MMQRCHHTLQEPFTRCVGQAYAGIQPTKPSKLPSDWQELHDVHGMDKFAAVPLVHCGSVRGVLILVGKGKMSEPGSKPLEPALEFLHPSVLQVRFLKLRTCQMRAC